MNIHKGTCEVCDAEKVDVYRMHGNIDMCETCKAAEEAITARHSEAINLISESKRIDNAIQIKADVFTAATVAAPELRAAIDNNLEIPANMKDFAFAQACMERFKALQQVIFEQRQALLEKETELRVWQANVQTAAGKLREEYKAQFKAVDIAYQPAAPKAAKKVRTSTPVKTGKVKFNRHALDAAALKYDLPANGIQSLVVQRNISIEDAAKQLAELMGKPLPTN